MAYVEVEIPESEGGEFFQFKQNGDVLEGRYISKGMGAPGQYGARMEYKFKTRTGPITCTAPAHLAAGLELALSDGRLKPGYLVRAEQTGEKQLEGREKPMRLFKLQIDATPKAAATPAAKSAASAPPAGDDKAKRAAKLRADLAALEGGGDDLEDIPF